MIKLFLASFSLTTQMVNWLVIPLSLKLDNFDDHPDPKKRRKRIQDSKKIGCPAELYLLEIAKFADY